MKLRFRYRLLEKLQYFRFAFFPKTTILVCIAAMAVIDAVLGFWMSQLNNGTLYDILQAILTGVTASFLVSIAVEMSNNYKHNMLAWHELQDYYSAVTDYELHKQVLMKQAPHQRAEEKAQKEFVDAGGILAADKEDQPKDGVQAVWEQLPKLIPVLRITSENKKAYLTNTEIIVLRNLMAEYEEIRSEVFQRIWMSLLYNTLNHPDEEYLKGSYPRNILSDMPEWMRKCLASNQSEASIQNLTDAIMSDHFLLSYYMEEYDISQRSIDSYKSPLEEMEDEEYEYGPDDADQYDFTEEEADEETFKAQQAEFDRKMEEMRKPFVVWHISSCCKNIAICLDELEKSMISKPYYGWKLKAERDFSKARMNDPLTQMAYEAEKKQLDKLLQRQRQGSDANKR